MTIVLRDYQQNLKTAIYNDWNSSFKNVLAVLPTGGGKSVVVSDIVLDGVRAGLRQAVIAHRNELVAQMSMHVARRGIPHRIVGSSSTLSQIVRQHRKELGKSFVNPTAQTAVIGVDTLIARTDTLGDWARQTDRWIIDEAHHVLAENKWGKAVAMFPNAQGLGVTATPSRADGQGLGAEYDGVFHSMQVGTTMRWLIDNGSLSEYEIICPKSDLEVNDNDVAKSGDWSARRLKEAAKKSHIVGDVVTTYSMYAYGKQAICFATDIETAGDIAKRFNEAGISAASLSSKTPTAVREKYTEEFKTGKLKVLINVDLFDEGFDVPACEVVIMARPTASLGKYLQMVGRCLRTAQGKQFGLIIDHVSNVIRHGLPDKERPWSLARRDKRGKQSKDPDEIPLMRCTSCTKPHERFHTACPYCGHTPPLPEPTTRSLEMVDGDLILLDRATLEAMRQATELESPADVAARVSLAAGNLAGRGAANRQIEKFEAHERLKDAIAQWAAVERSKGFDDRQIHKKFFLTTGCDVLTALNGSQSRQDFVKLAETVEGWYL